MSSDKLKKFFQKNVGYIVVFIVSLVYIATAFIQISETQKSVGQIIVDGTVVFALGFSINRIFDLQGIMRGEMDDRYQSTVSLHADTVIKISPYIEKLDEWCDGKNRENLRIQRTRILASAGLKYSDYFDEDGAARDIKIDQEKMKSRLFRRMERKRILCFYKALYIKLTPLSAGELTSEGSKNQDPFDFGRTKQQYERQTSARDAVSKIVIALIFGYYSVSLIQEFSYATLIWNCLQVALFVLLGSVSMYNSYFFITGEYRGRIVKKINHLEMFDNCINANKKIYEREEKQEEVTSNDQ